MSCSDIIIFLKENIVALLGCVITIIGLICNYRNLKKTLRNDMDKLREEKTLNKMEDLSLNVISAMQLVMDANNEPSKITKAGNELKEAENKILAYGSADAVKICCFAQKNHLFGGEFIYGVSGA